MENRIDMEAKWYGCVNCSQKKRKTILEINLVI